MIDAKRLLDQFLGAGAGGSTSPDLRESAGSPAHGTSPLGGQGGGLGSDFGGLGAHLGSGLGSLGNLGESMPGGQLGAGALAGYLLGSKRGRKLGGKAARMGGLALLAGLAYRAYQEHQSGGEAPAPDAAKGASAGGGAALPRPPADTDFLPAPGEEDDRARLLLSAMISAAKADGYVDAQEQRAIFDKIDALDLDPEDKAFVLDEMRAPLDLDGLVRRATSPELASEVYLASLLAIDPDDAAEKAYLEMLAARLKLDPGLAAKLRAAAEEAREA